jgi:hypothetical protein
MKRREFVWTSQGFTSFSRHSYEVRAEDLARIDSRLGQVAPFSPVCAHLQALTCEARKRIQLALLNEADHGYPYSIRLGVLSSNDATWLREEVTNAYHAFLLFIRARGSKSTVRRKSLTGFLSFLRSKSTELHDNFLSFLNTSALNYTRDCPIAGADDIFDRLPLLAESGADIMMGSDGPMFAEFNSVTGSYPHSLNLLRQSYENQLPDLFAALAVVPDTFREDRLNLIEKTAGDFGADCQRQDFSGMVLDAWSCQAHLGMSHKDVAERLGVEYLIFDEQRRSNNHYAERSQRAKKLFLYNAVQSHLIEPDAAFFQTMTRHGFEIYDDLGWSGVLHDYLSGKTLMSASPIVDLIDDKALFMFLPSMVEYFLDRPMTLPVNGCQQLWCAGDPSIPNQEALKLATRHQEAYVVAHRYLSGGKGIFVGNMMSPEDWNCLLEEHVCRNPSWFVLRDYFRMDPIYSLRTHLCASIPAAQISDAVDLVVSTDFFGRIALDGSVDNASSGGQVFLAVESPKVATWMRTTTHDTKI